MGWKDGVVKKLTGGVGVLLKKNGATVLKGWAQIIDGKTVEVHGDGEPHRVTCEHLLLATGSVPVELPSLPFGGAVISSTEALSLPAVPKRLIVVGAGYIGLELGTAYRKLGAEVTVVEAQGTRAARLRRRTDAAGRQVIAEARRQGAARNQGSRIDRRRQRRSARPTRTARASSWRWTRCSSRSAGGRGPKAWA